MDKEQKVKGTPAYEKPVLTKHARLKEVTLSSTGGGGDKRGGSGKKDGKGGNDNGDN